MEQEVNSLSFVQWNCHSLYSNLSHFKLFLYNYKPHVVCLSETWLKADRLPSFVNYTSFFKLRLNRQGGGLAFLIRNDLCVMDKTLEDFPEGQLEAQAVTVCGCDSRIDILNLYNPSCNVSEQEFRYYFDQLTSPCMVLGDFNAHNPLWSTQGNTNATGNNLVAALYTCPDLCLLTPVNFQTYYHTPSRSFSTLDLCFLSSELFSVASIALLGDLGSDHTPIHIVLNYSPVTVRVQTRKRWIFGDVNEWNAWRNNLPPVTSSNDIHVNYEAFSNALLSASHSTFKISSGSPTPKYSKVWWTAECSLLVADRHKLKNHFRRHPTIDNLLLLRKAEARVKRAVKKAKVESFKVFCSSMSYNTPASVIWKRVRQLNNKSPKRVSVPLVHGENIFTAPVDKANLLASHYEVLFNGTSHTVNAQQLLLPVTEALLDDVDCGYGVPITKYEIDFAIGSCKSNSPGHDQLHNDMFKQMPDEYRDWALCIMNQSFSTSILPGSLKLSIVNPILKPQKPAIVLDNYRPISLLPCFSKLLEKVLQRRLNYYLESKVSYSPTQGGFRKRLSTLDQIARLEQVIRCSLASRGYCVVVFFDLSSAYDTIFHLGLLYKLVQLGIRGKLLRWIKEFLSGRTFKVLFEGSFSSTRDITTGVPQGSVLSPTLFNVMMSDIPHVPHVQMAEYADDIVIFANGWDYKLLCQQVQQQVSALHAWTQQWGLVVNPVKTKGMIFSLLSYVSPKISLGTTEIEFVREHKYLGLYFDAPRLNWSRHISYLRTSCLGKINLLRSISGSSWGADRHILLMFYISLIRSKLDYGSIFYESASKTTLDALSVIQNVCLRTALGVWTTTPILSLEAESNIPPLAIHRKYVLFRYFARFLELPRSIPVVEDLLQNYNKMTHIQWSYPARVAPLIVRGRTLFTKFDIPYSLSSTASLLSPCPPWFAIDDLLCSDFTDVPVKYLAPSAAQNVFNGLVRGPYKDGMAIYTDGSLVMEPQVSVGAAFVIQQGTTFESYSWRLPVYFSIVGAELYAIYRALLHLKVTHPSSVGIIVIFTDSWSSLELLRSPSPSNYVTVVYDILQLILELSHDYVLKLQFVPGHKGIAGNERADSEAKLAHNLPSITHAPISAIDRISNFRVSLRQFWQTEWDTAVASSGKGTFLKVIKPKLSFWPWSNHSSRAIETVLAKLRVGHANVADRLYKIRKKDTPQCFYCTQAETIEHFLLLCPNYVPQRTVLQQSFLSLKIPINLVNLLGGGPYDPSVQASIVSAVSQYLVDCHRLFLL